MNKRYYILNGPTGGIIVTLSIPPRQQPIAMVSTCSVKRVDEYIVRRYPNQHVTFAV